MSNDTMMVFKNDLLNGRGKDHITYLFEPVNKDIYFLRYMRNIKILWLLEAKVADNIVN